MEIQYVVLDKLVPVRIYLRQPIHPIPQKISNPRHLQIEYISIRNFAHGMSKVETTIFY